MQTVGEFLGECSGRMAPFDRLRVGRMGCAAGLIGLAVALTLMGLGIWDTGGRWAAGFRFVVLCGLGSVILLFVVVAFLETRVEQSIRSRVIEFIRGGGADLETLVKAAEMRQSQVRGCRQVLALLKELPG
jgi:hypothetical protein